MDINPSGILLIDKPIGWTSFDVVAKVRGGLKQLGVTKPKVGHAGTLDPLATGLLIILVGSYTKKASAFSGLDKIYQAEVMLGSVSTTDDKEGVIKNTSTRIPSTEEIKNVLKQFLGESEQVPPQFSAVKVNGKRAYKIAREGKQPEIKPRNIKIYTISDINYRYPTITFSISVSSGTYIRSIARDIGEKLGTGAYLCKLVRTEIGNYKLTDAHQLQKLDLKNLSTSVNINGNV